MPVDHLGRREVTGLLGGAEHGGVDGEGRDGVGGDALAGELGGDGLGHGDHAALRRRVVGLAGRGGLAGGGGDRDDPAPPAGDHVADRRLDAVERAGEVDVEGPLPLLGGDVLEADEPGDGGAGDEDLDRAERRADLLVGGLDRALGRRRRPGSRSRERRRHRARAAVAVGGVAVEVEDGDGVASAGEVLGDGPADAGGAAGDDGDAAHRDHRRHRVPAAHGRGRRPAGRVEVDLPLGPPVQHLVEGDPSLDAGEGGAEAVVGAVAEGERLADLAVDVEAVGVVEAPLVAVAGRDHQQQRAPGRDRPGRGTRRPRRRSGRRAARAARSGAAPRSCSGPASGPRRPRRAGRGARRAPCPSSRTAGRWSRRRRRRSRR